MQNGGNEMTPSYLIEIIEPEEKITIHYRELQHLPAPEIPILMKRVEKGCTSQMQILCARFNMDIYKKGEKEMTHVKSTCNHCKGKDFVNVKRNIIKCLSCKKMKEDK